VRILVADDDPVSRRLLESSLERWGYEVVVAEDGISALAALRAPNPPKLAVLDWMMPGLDGVAVCREIRQSKDADYTYILLLTVKGEKGDVIAGLEAGADDYLTKPFDPQELKVRLRTGTRILYLLEQLIATAEALRDLASRDPLTGLANRATILDALAKELHRAQRQGTTLGVALADIDHFKWVNDTHGHLVGDELLREVAGVMRRTIRPYDSVGRYGGEEFLLLLPACDPINAVSHAERMRKAIGEMALETPNGKINVTASLGVTISDGLSTDVNQLIQAADEALYRAKRAGRNRVEFTAMDQVALA
jgi:two-component system cell cycle response regulator